MDNGRCRVQGGKSGLECVLRSHAELGEGPVWSDREQALLWVDIYAGCAHRFVPSLAHDEVLETGQAVSLAVPRRRGGYLLAIRDGFATLVRFDARPEMLVEVETDLPGNRMNDGACDSRGRLWAGTMADDCSTNAGTLYRLDANGTLSAQVCGTTVSNGIGWSPADDRMYYIDSPRRSVDAFAWEPDEGALGERVGFIDCTGYAGAPDGLAVDQDGCVWVAFFGGGCLRRFTAAGDLDRLVDLPVTQVTSCAFGGPRGDVLYVTTACRGLTRAERERQSHAGDLFALDAGTTGVPAASYAG